MSGNLFAGAAAVPDGTERPAVRTDYLLKNMYAYMLKKHYPFDTVEAVNDKEKDVLEFLKKILKEYRNFSSDNTIKRCQKIPDFNEKQLKPILLTMFHEIFPDDIRWCKIIGYIDFIGKFAVECIMRKLPREAVQEVYIHSVNIFSEHLDDWIEKHGGWMGIYCISPLKPSWVQFLSKTAVKIIATILDS